MAKPKPPTDTAPRPNWIVRFVQSHARAFFFTLGTLVRNPVGTFLTALVIGVVLALPAGFHLALQRITTLSYSWENGTQISLFLKDNANESRGRELAQQLAHRDGIAKAQYISREQALKEFRELSGFGDALDVLESNPLPAVIVLTPARNVDADATRALVADLGKLPEVELAKFDQEWIERLQSLLALAQRAVWVIAGVLALAVIVVIGNTIRLDLQARRDEIAVMKLIGAPDAFIRRPFLYAGLWYGIAGAVFAWLLVTGAALLLAGPAQRVMALYGAEAATATLSLQATLALFGAGLAIGLAGAQLTVRRHLAGIQPDSA